MSKYLQTKDENWKTGAKNKKEAFLFVCVIGWGVFGKVWKAKEKATGKYYAIKQMSKAEVIAKKGLKICFNQRSILPSLHYGLIPTLEAAFQTELHLYLVFPWLSGGDLRYHLTKFKQFEEKEVRFFAACIISSLEYLRQNKILHRDIKPENLILDQAGYLYLADFGISSNISDSGTWLECGTPSYMAPEILFDYFALGVILYQIIMGERPYNATNKQQLKQKITQSSTSIKKQKLPDGWSVQSMHFVNKLLHRNHSNRLGVDNIKQLKQHPWLINFPWDSLTSKQLQSPYKNTFKQWQIDYSLFEDKNINPDIQQIQVQLISGKLQQLFDNFNMQPVEKSVEWTTKPSMQIKRQYYH